MYNLCILTKKKNETTIGYLGKDLFPNQSLSGPIQ